jgi:beta-lactamase regulating signal transducer with metallopeptidase domain
MAGLAEIRGLGLIVECFLKSSVVLAVAILCSRLLRRRSASLRHFLLSVFLVGLVVFPALSVFSHGWHTRLLPTWLAVKPDSSAPRPAAADGASLHILGLSGRSKAGAGAPDLAVSAKPEESAGIYGLGRASGFVLLSLWSVGLVLLLVRLAVGIWGARRLTREGEPLDDSVWQRLLHRFVWAVSLKRKVDLRGHPQVIVPLTWGFLQPVVIMPEAARAWNEDERSSALFHELSHVKRGDFLVMVMVRLSLAMFWINPLCWLVYKMLKNEQEKACDELVLKSGIRPSTYANNLLSFKRSARVTRAPSAAFLGVLGMFGRSQLNERLLAILGQKTAFKEVRMKTKVIVSALAFLAVAWIGLARPQGAVASSETAALTSDAPIAAAVLADQKTPPQNPQKAAEKQKKETQKPPEPQEKAAKAKKEMKIVVEGAKGQEEPVEITIIDGKNLKTIMLDKPVIIIKEGEDGKKIVTSSEGKEVVIAEGQGVQLEVKGGKMTHLKEGKILKLAKEPIVFTVIEGEGKEGDLIFKAEPLAKIVKAQPHLEIVKEAKKPKCVSVKVVCDKAEGESVPTKRYVTTSPHVAVQIDEEGLEKKIAETQALLKKIEGQKLAESSLEAQKEALRELQDSLEALQEELNKKSDSLKALKIQAEPRVEVEPKVYVLPHVKTGQVDVKEIPRDEESGENIITVTRDNEAYTVVMTVKLKENPKETYEKAVARLRQELPEGYELAPKLIEESGTMIIKITGRNATEESRDKVQNLLEELRAELKK